MNKVDVIRPGSLKQIIGPSGTLKRIIKNTSYFNERGYDVNIYTHDSIKEDKANVTPVLDLNLSKGVKTKIKKYLRANLYRSKLFSQLFLERGDKQIKNLINYYLAKNKNPNYVVFHSVNECYFFLKENKQSEVKTVCFFHSDGIPLKMLEIYFPKLKGGKYFSELLEREKFVVENVSCCVFIAEHGRKNFLEYYKNSIDISRTRLILNGIEDFTEDEQGYVRENENENEDDFKYRFCCVGTINTRKGHRVIINALAQVNKEILPKVHFTFVGDGAERIILEKRVKDLGLSKNVDFVGAVDNKEVYKYLQKANIYILMSFNEGLPISIIEAMRSGLPVISTKIAGIPELVNNTNGVVIDPDVNQLVSVLNDIEEYNWEKLGEKSRSRFINEFTFDRMKKEYCDMLDNLK